MHVGFWKETDRRMQIGKESAMCQKRTFDSLLHHVFSLPRA
jgi:hypothetical protein